MPFGKSDCKFFVPCTGMGLFFVLWVLIKIKSNLHNTDIVYFPGGCACVRVRVHACCAWVCGCVGVAFGTMDTRGMPYHAM